MEPGARTRLLRWLPLATGLPVVILAGLWFGWDRPEAPHPVVTQPVPMTGQTLDLDASHVAAPLPTTTSPPEVPVMITVLLTPAGASGTASLDGKEVGLAPGAFAVPKGTSPVTFTVNVRGYRPASMQVVPDMGKTVTVPLKKEAKRP